MELNEEQQQVAEIFFNFLFNNESAIIIAGPGGTGKTFLVQHIIDKVIPTYNTTCELIGKSPEYQTIYLTATTHKAAEVLGSTLNYPVQTIHSLLGLRVANDIESGERILTSSSPNHIHNSIIIVDEASMLSNTLYEYIEQYTHKCKIVFVGDDCQLAPINEQVCPVFTKNISTYSLTKPMRNGGNVVLQELCSQLRDTVNTGNFGSIKTTKTIIDLLTTDQYQQELDTVFKDPHHNCKVITYTNAKAISYNDYFRELRGYTNPYEPGEHLVLASPLHVGKLVLPVEAQVQVLTVGEPIIKSFSTKQKRLSHSLEFIPLTIEHKNVVMEILAPANKNAYKKLIDKFRKLKDWKNFFYLTDNYADLRTVDASTIHKAQGSTYDTVYVDLNDMYKCTDLNTAARLLYVAFTRAKKRIALFGKLPAKFGSIVCQNNLPQ